MEGLVWIVDWDIPSDSAAKRVRFYRALKKLWKAHEGEQEMSTQSVLITDSEALAIDVYLLAKRFGVAHLYTGSELHPADRPLETEL